MQCIHSCLEKIMESNALLMRSLSGIVFAKTLFFFQEKCENYQFSLP